MFRLRENELTQQLCALAWLSFAGEASQNTPGTCFGTKGVGGSNPLSDQLNINIINSLQASARKLLLSGVTPKRSPIRETPAKPAPDVRIGVAGTETAVPVL